MTRTCVTRKAFLSRDPRAGAARGVIPLCGRKMSSAHEVGGDPGAGLGSGL